MGVQETMFDKAKLEAGYKAIIDGVWTTAEGSRATGEQAKAFGPFWRARDTRSDSAPAWASRWIRRPCDGGR